MAKKPTSEGKRRPKWTDNPVDTFGYRRLNENPEKRHPVKFADVLPNLVAKYGLARKLSIARFEEAFRTILDDLFPHSPSEPGGGTFGFIDKTSFRLIGYRAGTLQIEVSDAPLLSESTFYEGEILRRLQEALPDEKIRKIRWTLR